MADFLDPHAPTLARVLQRAGYATGHFGKWHMGGGRDVAHAPLPQEYGFHESLTQFEGLGERYLWRDGLNEQSAALGRGRIHWTEKHRMTEHYVDRAIDFMRRHSTQRFYFNLWPDDVHDVWLPRPELVRKYEGIARNDDEQKFFAVLDELDRQLGRLFDEVDRLGLAQQTIILFTSDNGPTDAPWYYERSDRAPGSTGGFRGRKLSLYEGGIRMPLIVRWPGHTPAGVIDDESVFAAIDLVPSLARLAGAPLLSDVPLDGVDVSPALLGQPVQRREPIHWYFINRPAPSQPQYFSPNYAIRDGRWKLLMNGDGSALELYDLVADSAESSNLARDSASIAARLVERVKAWRSALPADIEHAAVPKNGKPQ
jgi:arylsulfatase A-like enzyme